MADASVRPAVPDDADTVARLLLAHWVMSPLASVTEHVVSLDPADVAQSWRDAITDPPSRRHLTLVACAGTQAVGFLAAAPADSDGDVEVLELVVTAGHRRQGHGSRLLRAWADLSLESMATGGVVWVSGADDAARSFLTGAGWAPDGSSRALDTGVDLVRQVRLATTLTLER